MIRLLAVHDLRIALADRSSLVWLFVMPVVFMYFIGTITGGFSGPSQAKKPVLGVVVEGQHDSIERWLLERLGEEFDVIVYDAGGQAERTQAPALESLARRLVIPAGAGEQVLAGQQVTLRLEPSASQLGGSFDEVRVRRAVYRTLGDVILADLEHDVIDTTALAAVAGQAQAVTLRTELAGERVDPPSGFAQAVPGILVFLTIIVVLTTGTVQLVNERRQGLLRRLASAPIDRRRIVLGKWMARLALAVVQIGFAMLAGSILFSYDWTGQLLMVLVVLLAWAGVCASAALLIGCLVATESQATAIGVIGGNLLAALGGCWWPIEITPAWMQGLQQLLPTGWTMNALHKLITFGYGPSSVMGEVLALMTLGLILAVLAARWFRFQ